MEKWYQTIWGIIILGAFGSVLGAILLYVTKILISRLGPKVILRFSTNLLMPYAENRHRVEMLEKNDRRELIVFNYLMTMSKYTRTQIVFILTAGISVFTWGLYFKIQKLPIILPLVFLAMAIIDFYDFIKWYLAVSGCITTEMIKFGKEIKNLKKRIDINLSKTQ